MFHTYILESEKTGRLYIGQTNDITERLRRHNAGVNLSTKAYTPWRLCFLVQFPFRSEAVQLEIKLKAFKNPKKVKDWIDVHK